MKDRLALLGIGLIFTGVFFFASKIGGPWVFVSLLIAGSATTLWSNHKLRKTLREQHTRDDD